MKIYDAWADFGLIQDSIKEVGIFNDLDIAKKESESLASTVHGIETLHVDVMTLEGNEYVITSRWLIDYASNGSTWRLWDEIE